MNNDIFKKFIEPYYDLAISKLTPVLGVESLEDAWPQHVCRLRLETGSATS